MVYTAAVIGLGNIGFKFDLDAKRKETWTHVAAYQKCPLTKLVACVEPDPVNVRLFKQRHPQIPVYATVNQLFDHHDIDVASVCVPTPLHAKVLWEVLGRQVRTIFCEKPLSMRYQESARIVSMARKKKVQLAVNYVRRWQTTFQAVKAKIEEGGIGHIQAAHAFYPGQIFNIGSHLMDTVLMVTGLKPKRISAVKTTTQGDDPSLSGWIECAERKAITFAATGKREDLIFEIDVIGDEGRIRILDNGGRIEWGVFKKSRRYSGYREIVAKTLRVPEANDRFLDAVTNIARNLTDKNEKVLCCGSDGLIVDRMIERALCSAKRKGSVETI